MRDQRKAFLGFAIIGVVGFGVDAAVVAIAVHVLGFSPYQARLCSYLFAVATTWWLNRRYTFRSTAPPFREFLAFLLANAFGASIIAWRGSAGWLPIFAVAVGSLAGLSINFLFSSKVVFRERPVAPVRPSQLDP
jgi:putative flippase GtrA